MRSFAEGIRAIACFAAAVALFTIPGQAQVVINELHYHPADPNGDAEFIELHNSGAAPVDISGWTLSGFAANAFTFPTNTTIDAGGYVVVARDALLLQSLTGYLADHDWATGNLSNGGEIVTLTDDLLAEVDSVSYDDAPPWPDAPDGAGPSLELIHPDLDNSSPLAWAASVADYGTPGTQNSVFSDSPIVLGESPARLSVVEALPTVSLTFSEPVQNVAASDLSVNGSAATSVSGSGAGPYEFSGFAAPVTAPISVDIASGAIEDLDSNTFGGASWFYPNVVINELHYHPADPNGDAEFIELLNAGTVPADVSGWLIDFGPVPFQFPAATTLAAGSVTVVAMDPVLLQTLTGYLAPHQWPASALSNGGELVTLSVSLGVEADRVDYGDQNDPPWPASPDGEGPSLELIHPSLDNEMPLAWKGSAGANGTPGATNSVFDDGPIVIAELPSRGAFIGGGLTQVSVTFHEEVTGVVAGDLIVDGAAATGVTGSGAGPYVFTVPAPSSDQVAVAIGPGSIQDLAANPFAGDSWQYVLALPDVVINEIHYHPSDAAVGAGEDSERLQFLELYNGGTAAVDLTGWRFTDGVSFDFPAGSSIAAGEHLLIAADGTFLAATVTTIPGGTQIFDWDAGDLENGGEALRLTDPFGNTIDRVEFNDEGIWPVAPDGTGPSLELINPNLLNEYALSWEASSGTNGTPGEPNSVFNLNPAPVIAEVSHDPPIPAGGASVTITARAFDASPIPPSSVQVCHRQDQSPTVGYSCVPMLDNGLSGDGAAGDGLYGAVLAGLANDQRMDFAIATSGGGGLTLAPRGHDCGLTPGSVDCAEANPSQVFLIKFSDAGVPTDFPSYHLITTQVTRDAQAAHDKTEYDGTIVHCGTTGSCEIHYNVIERYRGRGSLRRHPHSYNIRFPDKPVKSEMGFVLRTLLLLGVNPQRQEIGHGLFERAGHPAPQRQFARIVRNPTPHEGYESWVYLNIERVDEDFMSSQGGAITPPRFPDRCSLSDTICETNLDCPAGETCDNTDRGNIYRGRGSADLRFEGPTVGPPLCDGPYRLPCGSEIGGYQKTSNVDEDVWTDLINMTDALTCSTTDGGSICVEGDYDGSYESNLPNHIDVQPFAAWFAMHNLIVNTEGGIYRDTGDDYFVAFQPSLDHGRMITWDMDAIMGTSSQTIWRTEVQAPERVIERNAIAGYFVGEICRLLNDEFSVATMNAVIDAIPEELFTQPQSSENQGGGPRDRQGMQNWVVSRHANILTQISMQTTLTGVPASPYTDPDPVIQLSGNLNQCGARRVLVNDVEADQYQIFTQHSSPTWSHSFTLSPGINHIVVETVDHDGNVIDSASDVVSYGLCDDDGDCSDGTFCNGAETCDTGSGVCLAGTPVDCSDAVACTEDSCNETTDTCDRTPDHGACDDGNVCTDDTCDTVSGCQNVDNSAPCEDGDLCTGPDVCAGGACVAGLPLDCDDLIACTDDSCDSAVGCINLDNCAAGEICNLSLGICETDTSEPLPILIGDEFTYFKGTEEPSPGGGGEATTDWAQIGFDDSTWLSGPSGFAYGSDGHEASDPDTNTVITDMSGNYVSLYFRRPFQIDNPAAVSSLTLTIDYDDAFVVYVNGVEITRSALLSGLGSPPAHDQPADSGGSDHEGDTTEQFDLAAAIPELVAGTNVLAFQVHNATLGSPDLVFRPLLDATLDPDCAIDADCDDGEVCTDDTCNTGTGECVFTPDDSNVCDDGNACTDDACSGGVCVSTNDDTNSCTDVVACTDDACTAGVCVSTNNCTGGDVCNVITGICEIPAVIQSGDVIVAGFQATNDIPDQVPSEFISLFNTTASAISLEGLQIVTRVGSSTTVEWDMVSDANPDLTGKTIQAYSFFLIAESGVAAPSGNLHDVELVMDLATDEGGINETAIGIEVSIDGKVVDNVLYGFDGVSSTGVDAPGDLAWGGTPPRVEVIRDTLGDASFVEGVCRRLSDTDLHAGHDVEGYYRDEDTLGRGYPDGVWTSPHSTAVGSYQARNSLSAAVPPPSVVCTTDLDCDDGSACTDDSCVAGTCVRTPTGVCSIEGDVFYYRDFNLGNGFEPSTKGVADVDIDIDQDSIPDATSVSGGAYIVSAPVTSAVVTPLGKFGATTIADHNGAISPFDATFIAEALVGIGDPLSTRQLIAADVSNDGTLSSYDAARVAQFSVGLLPGDHFAVALDTQSDWAFFRCDNYVNETDQDCGPATYLHDPLTVSEVDDDFYALLYGDVTGNWEAGQSQTASEAALPVRSDPERQAWLDARSIRSELGDADAARRLALLSTLPWGELRPEMHLELVAAREERVEGVRRLTYRLVMHSGDGLQGLDLELRPTAGRVRVVEVRIGDAASDFTLLSNASAGKHKIALYGVLPLQGSGTLLELTVEMGLLAGEVEPFEISARANERPVQVKVVSEKQTLQSAPYGVGMQQR